MKKMALIVDTMMELTQKEQEISQLKARISGMNERILQLEHRLNFCSDESCYELNGNITRN